jgi:Family of unknown function (DUF6216)
MEISTLSGSARDVVSALSVLGLSVGAIVTSTLLVWVSVRTRSAHPVLARLWLHIRGKREIRDAEIQGLMEELDKLTWFHFMTAIRPRTLKDVKALIAWCSSNNVSLNEVRACGWLFDLDNPGLLKGKAPGRGWLILGVPAFAALFAGVLAAIAVAPSSALMQGKDSGRWFWMSAEQAKPLPAGGRSPLQRGDCSADHALLSRNTGFSEHEVTALCDAFNRGDSQKDVARNVEMQRVFFGWIALSSLWFGRMLLVEFNRIASARRLSRRLDSH